MHLLWRESLPFELVLATVWVIQVHEELVAFYTFSFSRYSAMTLQLAFALMSGEKVRIPQIENDATAFTHSRCEPPPQSHPDLLLNRNSQSSGTRATRTVRIRPMRPLITTWARW